MSIRRPLAILMLSLAAALPAFAAEPGLHDIYAAADAGQLDRAQHMIDEVLSQHPDSAKAHYVAAELDARQGRLQDARQQLATAERLQPGLPFAKPASVQALRAQLGTTRTASPLSALAAPQDSGRFPVGPLLFGLLVIGGLGWWLTRRRSPEPAASWSLPAPASPLGTTGLPPSAPAAGGGFGSSLGRGLATGLGIGAGLMAGEALADRLIHGGESAPRRLVADEERDIEPNADMGGEDFGVGDSGGWDDSGSDSDWS